MKLHFTKKISEVKALNYYFWDFSRSSQKKKILKESTPSRRSRQIKMLSTSAVGDARALLYCGPSPLRDGENFEICTPRLELFVPTQLRELNVVSTINCYEVVRFGVVTVAKWRHIFVRKMLGGRRSFPSTDAPYFGTCIVSQNCVVSDLIH